MPILSAEHGINERSSGVRLLRGADGSVNAGQAGISTNCEGRRGRFLALGDSLLTKRRRDKNRSGEKSKW